MKREVDTINAVPSKRLFLSIIADYDLNRSICELIDNALDQWVLNGKKRSLMVNVSLNLDQQTIRVTDNAGGVKKEELSFIVGPGQTGNRPSDQVIGIFGVGTKRAVVALAQDIRITTRFQDKETYRIEFDEEWLKSEDWELLLYEIDEIERSTTIIDLYRLRFKLTNESISHLKKHVQATYAKFLENELFTIIICDEEIVPITFDNWAYPPNYEPRRYIGTIQTEDGDCVKVEVIAGLSQESSPIGEYGIYFYCNDRLIAKELKNYEVGFTTGIAGQPHPSISLIKVIISLWGEAKSMPWNSSKSGISYQHTVFVALQDWLLRVVKDWASLSRRLESNWREEVFQYKKGSIMDVIIDDFPQAKSSYLPPLPKAKPRYIDRIININKVVAQAKPWVKGLYEGIVAVDFISSKKLEQRNRINLIILDSTLEIALKEYLVNESGETYSDKRLLELFADRSAVHQEIKRYGKIDQKIWNKIEYFYRLRNKIIHERASVSISDKDLENYRDVVEFVLTKLFGLRFNV
jgi:hypothetical protein